jgi:hypothetical protein
MFLVIISLCLNIFFYNHLAGMNCPAGDITPVSSIGMGTVKREVRKIYGVQNYINL